MIMFTGSSILLLFISTLPWLTSCTEIKYERPSGIIVNENFKESIALPPEYPVPIKPTRFIQQGRNFFINPYYFLGNQIPSSAVITANDSHSLPLGKNKTHKAVKDIVKTKLIQPSNIEPQRKSKSGIIDEIVNKTLPATLKGEVIEPHDIITISKELQPVLKPKVVITEPLLRIPEAPILPPLLLPEPVKLSADEFISVPSNVPLLTESTEYPTYTTEFGYKINEMQPLPAFPPIFFMFPHSYHSEDKLSSPPKIPLTPNIPTPIIEIAIPLPALYANNIFAQHVIPNTLKVRENITTENFELPVQ